jgi:hypothetical protein
VTVVSRAGTRQSMFCSRGASGDFAIAVSWPRVRKRFICLRPRSTSERNAMALSWTSVEKIVLCSRSTKTKGNAIAAPSIGTGKREIVGSVSRHYWHSRKCVPEASIRKVMLCSRGTSAVNAIAVSAASTKKIVRHSCRQGTRHSTRKSLGHSTRDSNRSCPSRWIRILIDRRRIFASEKQLEIIAIPQLHHFDPTTACEHFVIFGQEFNVRELLC